MSKAALNAPTYCNPLPIPDYPRGRWAHRRDMDHWWIDPAKPDFREMADPSVLYHDGKWYLYPSCGMAWVSDDLVNWRHHRVEPYDCGYAPTVEHRRGEFLLTACGTGIWRADNPLGPFEEIGPVLMPDGSELIGGKDIPTWRDPMLFCDDDDRLFAYWGLGEPGIFGVELDPAQPNRMLSRPTRLFGFDPSHVWERMGEHNEHSGLSWTEGAWMFKHGSTYYLTYSAPGTSCRTYSMGCYVSANPLGPFRYQGRNPILSDRRGLVNGPGHGSIVRGPGGSIWAFYTCTVCNINSNERRIGMDPAGIDADGNLFVLGASETPQWAPGVVERPERGNDAGLLPVNSCVYTRASSYTPGREPAYAVDDTMRTYWRAAPDDRRPFIQCRLLGEFNVEAMRVCWAEPEMDYESGITPGPFKYRLDVSDDGESWRTALDCSDNQTDLLIDYRTFPPATAKWARLTVLDRPKGMDVGILQWTLFGKMD